MVLKFGSLIVSTIVCISLESVVAYRTHGENQYTFPQNDRIAFPEGTRQRPAIEVEYFENGTTIARYADGTPVVRPDTATGLLPTESNPRLSGSTPRLGVNINASLPAIKPKCISTDGTSLYCTQVQNYPRSFIENLVRSNADTILFKSDKLDNELDQRFGGFPNDEALCEFSDEVIYPQSGVTHDDIPFFIVNTQQQQGVRVEKCRDPDLPCSSKISLPLGYKSVCRQNYVYRELISPSNDLTALEKRNFKFPSCCSCMLQRV